jgi:VCBS repeat protein/histidine kinase/DNA gyrase B/HSP90-like ATPase
MMKMNKNSVFVFLIFTILAFWLSSPSTTLADTHYRWQNIDVPGSQALQIINANSKDDYWILTDDKNLQHFYNGSWTETLGIQSLPHRYIKYHLLDNNNLIALVVHSDYSTTLYKHSNNRWVSKGVLSNVPVTKTVQDSSGVIWLYDDWGEIFRYSNNEIVPIESPIEHHILYADFSGEDEIWFGTRAEGIWRYKESKWENINIPDVEFSDIQHFFFNADGTCVIQVSDGRILIYSNGVARTLDAKFSTLNYNDGYFRNGIVSNPGKSNSFFLWQNGFWNEVFISTFDGIRFVKGVGTSDLMVITNRNELLSGQLEKGLYFYNQSENFRVSGSLSDFSSNASLIDIDNNGSLDLFVQNGGFDGYNQLFRNEKTPPLSDITSESGLIHTGRTKSTVFGDINRDSYPDMITSVVDSSGISIQVFTNIFGHHFVQSQIINDDIPENHLPIEIRLVDFDDDGDLDIYLVYYYGIGENLKATNVILENRFLGRFRRLTKKSTLEIEGWNQSCLFADFDNDDFIDVYQSNRWNEDKILFGSTEGFLYRIDSYPDSTLESNTLGVIAFDADNDADLDMIKMWDIPLTFYFENNQKGIFTPTQSDDVFTTSDKTLLGIVSNVNAGDFNNDSFLDLVLSGNEKHRMFLNDKNGGFREVTEEVGFYPSTMVGSTIGDIDNDGDLDIYVFGDGHNSLWDNQLNNDNYIKLKIVGSLHSPSGAHTKVWLYTTGHLDDINYLIGYREIGSLHNGVRSTTSCNSNMVHFGTGISGYFDAKVKFYKGPERILKNIRSGSTLEVNEYNQFLSNIIRVPAISVTMFRRPIVQYYILTFFLAITIMLIGIHIALKYLKWGFNATLIQFLVNFSVFWILLFISYQEDSIIKYIIPLGFVSVGTFIPHLLIFTFRLGHTKIVRQQGMDELLQILLVFSHGEWALSNLNSIKRLGEFVLSAGKITSKQIDQLNERASTFKEMTLPNLERIIDLSNDLALSPLVIDKIKMNSNYLKEFLTKLSNSKELDKVFCEENKNLIGQSIDQIRSSIRSLKGIVYKEYSCDIKQILKNSIDTFLDNNSTTGIEIILNKNENNQDWCLIQGYELADILDNCFNNAKRALKDCEKKIIQITTHQQGGLSYIEIMNNGVVIDPDKWAWIFQSGMSDSGSSGQGLAQARSTLERYGGNIFIKESSPENGTTFTIQLKEGQSSF